MKKGEVASGNAAASYFSGSASSASRGSAKTAEELVSHLSESNTKFFWLKTLYRTIIFSKGPIQFLGHFELQEVRGHLFNSCLAVCVWKMERNPIRSRSTGWRMLRSDHQNIPAATVRSTTMVWWRSWPQHESVHYNGRKYKWLLTTGAHILWISNQLLAWLSSKFGCVGMKIAGHRISRWSSFHDSA